MLGAAAYMANRLCHCAKNRHNSITNAQRGIFGTLKEKGGAQSSGAAASARSKLTLIGGSQALQQGCSQPQAQAINIERATALMRQCRAR